MASALTILRGLLASLPEGHPDVRGVIRAIEVLEVAERRAQPSFDFAIDDENGGVWTPWTDGYAVGFKVTVDGKVEYIYLNPSRCDSDGGHNAFLYVGQNGDPVQDGAEHYYVVLDGEPER